MLVFPGLHGRKCGPRAIRWEDVNRVWRMILRIFYEQRTTNSMQVPFPAFLALAVKNNNEVG